MSISSIRMKVLLFAVACLASLSPVYATCPYIFHGQVQNENKEPVAYAIIQVMGKDTVRQADAQGRFSLTLVSGKEVSLTISATGYRTKEFTVPAGRNKQESIFTLPEGTIRLATVVVNGNSREHTQMKSPQNIVKIDKSYLEENFSGSLMQSLETIPGVKAMSIGSGQSKPAIRGLGFNRMIVAENGIKHEGQQWGEEHGLEIDQFAVDDIEIIKGPGSILYGSDAIGGVISLRNNYVPSQTIEGSLDLFGRSSNESAGLHAGLAGRKKRFHFKVNLTLIDYADYKVPADSIQYHSYHIKLKDRRLRNTAGKEQNAGINMGYISDNFTSSLYASDIYTKSGFFADAHGLEVRLSDIDYDHSSRDIDLPSHSVNHFKVANHSTWRIGKLQFKSDLSWQNNSRKELTEPVSHGYMPIPPDSLERKFDKNIYSANVSVKYMPADKHSIDAGINAEYQHNRRGGWGFIIPDFETTSLGAYLLDRYHVSNDLILSTGIRFDHIGTHIKSYRDWYKTPVENGEPVYKERSSDFKRSFTGFTYTAGINYKTESWSLKANTGKSFRVPIAKESGSDGVNYHIFRYEKGNPDLTPEQSYQLDAGIGWHNEKFEVQLSPYLNYFPNYIYLNPAADYYEGLQMYYYTQAKVIRWGFEADASYMPSRCFSFDLKGEYLYAEQLSGNKKGYTLPFSPPWSADTGFKYMPHKKWLGDKGHISVSYKFVGDQNEIVPPESKTKGYQTLNAALAGYFDWNGNTMRVSLQIHNLLNKRYYDHTSYYRLIDVPEPGRNFSVMTGCDF